MPSKVELTLDATPSHNNDDDRRENGHHQIWSDENRNGGAFSDSSGSHDLSSHPSPSPSLVSHLSPTEGSTSGIAGRGGYFHRYLIEDEVVISGISCRLPESDNMNEFKDHLVNGDDMVTKDGRRWEPGYFDLPERHGKLKDLTKFDAAFFGVHPKQASSMDPQLRLLLEVAYEALIDAGINPQQIRGSNTGVFVGCSGSETNAALTKDPETVVGYSLTGCVRSMFANRVSYAFDFRGPSFAVDTACSSSLLALQLALDAIRQEQCDAAVVAGTGLTLAPTTALQFLRLGMLSPQGKCQSFDANGDGYVRAEGVVAIFLQRSASAKRCYATVVHAKSNTDGYKEQGITFPSGDRQAQLLSRTYEEAGIHSSDVVYVEMHGTGTKVGDPQEANAVCDVLCNNNRQSPLLIGSVKSNMGHAEPASGLAAVAKILIAMETGSIPANLHYREPNPYITGLLDGRLKVVSQNTPWKPGLVGINSFGFGGSNTHVILKPYRSNIRSPTVSLPSSNVPRLLCFPGRTESAVLSAFEYFHVNKTDAYLHAFLSTLASSPLNYFPYRGFSFTNSKGNIIKEVKKCAPFNERRQLWFIYSGMGTQWAGMGRDLMVFDAFRRTITRCSAVLEPFGVDVSNMIVNAKEEYFENTLNCFTVITSIQVALTDLLKEVGLEPDGFIGHSTGEMAAAYCDGCMTAEETILCAYYRGKSILDANLPVGAMAAVGLTWQEVQQRLPPSLDAACHNSNDSVTISGAADDVKKFVEMLHSEKIFAKMVNSSGIPFHSRHLKPVAKAMRTYLNKLIPSPRLRSSRWISSSVKESEWETRAKYSSPDYHLNNILSPVLFREALSKVPENAVIVEMAPHCLLQAVIKRTVPSTCQSFGLMKFKHESCLDYFLTSLGHIYQCGINLDPQRLLAPVSFPVPVGTPMVSPVMVWDHSQSWPVMSAGDAMITGGQGSSCHYTIDPFASESKDAYVLDHVIDGRVLFPFTGYLELVWKTICRMRNFDYQKTPVLFENVNVYRPTLMSKAVKFGVTVSTANGDFEIIESDSLAASGRITILDEDIPFFYDRVEKYASDSEAKNGKIDLLTPDVYKEMLLRGYEYGPKFRSIIKADQSGIRTQIKWTGNWVTFLDAMLQCAILAEHASTLKLPARLRHLKIDPAKHLKCIQNQNDIDFVDAINDLETFGCSAGGVEICDLVAQSVARRPSPCNVTVERVQFVPYFDSECLSNENLALIDNLITYRKTCRHLTLNCAKNFLDLKSALSGDENLHEFEVLKRILATAAYGDSAKSQHLDDMKTTLAYFLRELQLCSTKNGQPVTETYAKTEKILKTNFERILRSDKMWNFCWTDLLEKPVKVLLDIVCENTAGHHLKGAFLEVEDLTAAKFLKNLHTTHPLLDGQWIMIGPNADKLEEKDATNVDACFSYYPISNLDNSQTVNKLLEKCGNLDLVVLDRILQSKLDVVSYLRSGSALLRDDGFMIVCETTSDFETSYILGLFHSLAQGNLSEFVSNNLNGFRKYGLFYEHEYWMSVFSKCGLQVIAHQYDKRSPYTMYLLRKVSPRDMEPAYVPIDDVEKFAWVEPLQEVILQRLNDPQEKTIWVTSNTTKDNGIAGLALCLREESYKNRMRCIGDISLSPEKRYAEELKLSLQTLNEILHKDVTMNLYRDGIWGSMRHIPLKKEEMHYFENTEHAFINTLVRGDLNSLAWVESANKFWRYDSINRETQWLCDVNYASLNFRDIMLATGRLTADAIPGNFTDRECLLGMEFAGSLRSNNSRVMGLLPAQALATTVVADSRFYWSVPNEWSLRDAATVPVVYSTAYYALIVRGRMTKHESILVHSGSGGVGQAAIRVALSMGCRVFTTVGSDEKKRILLERFPALNESDIANSRSTEFEFHIRKMTKGRGVDLVLNSLSEEKLQASVRCLSKHGRFLEIGKFDFAANNNLGMAVFLKNVTFHGILLDSIFDENCRDEWQKVYNLVTEGIKSGIVKPLASTVFDKDSVEQAFRFMAHGKHIGKVLVNIRPEESNINRIVTVKAIRRTLCHPEHVYLITGGLGGFGLELAKWLISRGAKKLVLSSRSGVKLGYQGRCIDHWRSLGVQTTISSLNIANARESEQLILSCREKGRLGGVFHLAMVLRDCLFENQSSTNFADSAQAKYFGTKHLDRATRKFCDKDLKWFVVFSSISCGRGNAGQTNYGWANSTMERIIEQRRFDRLPGLAIQWGAIGDVGIIAEHLGDNNTIVGGTLPQRIPSCLQTLDSLLCSDNLSIVSSFVKADTQSKQSNIQLSGDIVQTVAHILGISDPSQLDADANLGDLGLDSLMGVEIKQALERDFDLVLSMKDIRNLTLNKLKEVVASGNSSSLNSTSKDDDQSSEDLEALEKAASARSMFAMFRLRMDVNSLRPEKACVHLNDVLDGSPLFCVHSIEGVGDTLATLASKLKFPVYAFQCTQEAPVDSIESLASFYIEQMRAVQPQGPYRILGYSYGTSVAFEMATHLQRDCRIIVQSVNDSATSEVPNGRPTTVTGNIVVNLILLDGSHRYMKIYRNAYRAAYGVDAANLLNDVLFESEALCGFTLRFAPKTDYKQFRARLMEAPKFDQRVNMVVEHLMATGLFKTQDTVQFAAISLCHKMLAADRYEPQRKFDGNITLIRAEVGAAKEEDVGRDYGLSEVTTGTVDVHVVPGDHDTFIHGPSAQITANIIGKALTSQPQN